MGGWGGAKDKGGGSTTTIIQQTETVSDARIIDAWQTQRTAWVADDAVDFTVAEPALIAANNGKIFLNIKTGNGSTSKTTVFDAGDLYFVHDDLTWKEYQPKEGATLSAKGLKYTFINGAWLQDITKDHMHPIVGNITDNTYFRIASGKLWKNKTATPSSLLAYGQPGWDDNWEEFKPSNTGGQGHTLTPQELNDGQSTISGEITGFDFSRAVIQLLYQRRLLTSWWLDFAGYGKGWVTFGDDGKLYEGLVNNIPSGAAGKPPNSQYWVQKYFYGGISDWKSGEVVEKGFLRAYTFGNSGTSNSGVTRCILVSNYNRKCRPQMDATELTFDVADINNIAASNQDAGDISEFGGVTHQVHSNWTLINQERTILWFPGVFVINGLRMTLSGFSGEYQGTGNTAADFTYQEQINFGFTSSAASGVGTFVTQPGHGFNVANWLARTADGYVLAQPDDAALRETIGVVSRVVSDNTFVLESHGFGCDAYNSNNDDFWNYDPGTVLYLAADGTVTDVKPTGIARRLCTIIDPGYALIDQKTIEPINTTPTFKAWPTDSQLRDGGFDAFVYVGISFDTYSPGLYANPNNGNAASLTLIKPTKL